MRHATVPLTLAPPNVPVWLLPHQNERLRKVVRELQAKREASRQRRVMARLARPKFRMPDIHSHGVGFDDSERSWVTTQQAAGGRKPPPAVVITGVPQRSDGSALPKKEVASTRSKRGKGGRSRKGGSSDHGKRAGSKRDPRELDKLLFTILERVHYDLKDHMRSLQEE